MATHKLINVNGNIIVQANHDYPTIDHLPAAVYTLGMTDKGELVFAKQHDGFTLPTKIYGSNNRYYDVITSDFSQTEGSLGVMLIGLAGSGKTLLTESIANWMIAADRPVFWIKENKIPVELIRAAITVAANSGCLIIFDELSKLYPESSEDSDGTTQASLLTLFSDSGLKKVMFMATDNAVQQVNMYLMNRPGRFLYWIRYGKLSVDDITEFCNDFAVPTEFINEILYYCNDNDIITYDVLRIIVKTVLKSKDVADFKFRLDILNVPNMTWRKYKLIKVDGGIPDATYNLTVTDLDTFEITTEDIEVISFNRNDLIKIGTYTYEYRVLEYRFTLSCFAVDEKPDDIYTVVYDPTALQKHGKAKFEEPLVVESFSKSSNVWTIDLNAK